MTCRNGQLGTYRSTTRHRPFKLSCLTPRQIRKERVGRRIPGGPNAEEERCVSLPSLSPADWSRQVPIGQLGADLRTGDVPRFSYVVPDECHDMHGDPPYCLDSGNIKDPQNQHLVAVGDAYLGQLVSEITHAAFWAKGNNAIAITYDNGDNSVGCCDAKPGGGRIATVVVTSHGPRGIRDGQRWPTPTPTLAEPRSRTRSTASAGGWTVQRAGRLGGNDNSLGVIAGSSPRDIWAFGDFLPDAAGSNQDATLNFAEHYNGVRWTLPSRPTPG